VGIWLACDDSWYRECLVELLRSRRYEVSVADGAASPPPAGAEVLVVNHDPRRFDLFRWLPALGEAGVDLPIVALFDATDREPAAAAARSLPVFACHLKPIPNDIVALSVRSALEHAPKQAPAEVPSPTSSDGDRDFPRDIRRDVLQAFV
jgi:DNA-binding NtrC family response regulator